MAIDEQPRTSALPLDKEALRRAVERVNAALGLSPTAPLAPETVQNMMRAEGIRPEDCEFSREIIRLRDEGGSE